MADIIIMFWCHWCCIIRQTWLWLLGFIHNWMKPYRYMWPRTSNMYLNITINISQIRSDATTISFCNWNIFTLFELYYVCVAIVCLRRLLAMTSGQIVLCQTNCLPKGYRIWFIQYVPRILHTDSTYTWWRHTMKNPRCHQLLCG